MSRKLFWPILIISSAILAGILALSNVSGPIRSIIQFWFILVCPGMAVLRLLKIQDNITEFVLAIALSLIFSTLLAEVMVFAHLWSPILELTILIGISMAGAGLQIRNTLRSTI
jgi:uncharacterized membrane protein